MIYIADGPSDVPVFSVVRNGGGKAFAVYTPDRRSEFEQNDMLLETGRIDAYGPCLYTPQSPTSIWLRMHVRKICERILKETNYAVENRLGSVPRHLHNPAVSQKSDNFSPETGELDFGDADFSGNASR